VPVKLDAREATDVASGFHLAWTPTLVAVHPQASERSPFGVPVRQVVGFLPPGELRAELELMAALVDLRGGRAEAARERLHGMRTRFAGAHAAPEAMYWEGVARFRATGNKDRLFEVWRELVDAYPASAWALRTTLVE
jgi:hypothetical protein